MRQRHTACSAAASRLDSVEGHVAMAEFSARTVAPEQVHLLYPLMREAVPALDLKTWVAFARQLSRGTRTGIIAVSRRGRDLPCGAFIFRCQRSLRGAELVAEHFVALDVLHPGAVMQALVAELDALAERRRCTTVRVLLAGDASLLREGLTAAGHEPHGMALRKNLGPHAGLPDAGEERRS